MAIVCVGPGLRPDSEGRLQLQLCGNPAPANLCTAGGNGLRVSNSCGLWAPPPPRIASQQTASATAYPNPVVPANETVAKTEQLVVNNPDPCRPAIVNVEQEMDVWFTLPAGARAAYGWPGNEAVQLRNSGTSTIVGTHVTTTKVLWALHTIPPGGSVTVTLQVVLKDGAGGATYHNIDTTVRAQVIAV